MGRKDPVAGTTESDYAEVAEAFRANFEDNWEPEGAAFAAYVNGRLVCDLWGGYADRGCSWTWKEDTMTTIFSCTKALASICLATQVESGRLNYTDLVSQHWPEFAQGGKESLTVQEVLCHQAAIPFLRNHDGSIAVLDVDAMTDIEKMERIVEKQTTQFRPGRKSVYHAITFGWLADGIFRRVHPTGKTIGEFFNDEIASKHDLDVRVGETSSIHSRIARISPITASPANVVRECLCNWNIMMVGYRKFVPWAYINRAVQNFADICPDFDMMNNPDIRRASIVEHQRAANYIVGLPAVNGVGTARDLAKTLDLFAKGNIVSKHIFESMHEPVIVEEHDPTIGVKLSKGHGFMYYKSPLGDWQIGHTGVGGQNVKADFTRGITFAYLTNGMKAGQGQHTHTFMQLERALYRCYERTLRAAEARKDL